MGTATSRATAFAPCARNVSLLNSSTLGWSISYTTVSAIHGNRQARASRPAARMTTWRMPAEPAAMKKSSKCLVLAAA